MTTVGERVRAERDRRGWTVRELADRADVSHSYVSRLENGHAGEKRVELEKIARAFGVPLAVLLHDASAALTEKLEEAGLDVESRMDLIDLGVGLTVLDPDTGGAIRTSLRAWADLVRAKRQQRAAC